ncbi:MAG TPA: 50S ribosomal protein L21 [Ignavibacteriaceae bacterium]
MYAIVEIAGQQFKVAKDQQIFVHRLQGEEGDNLLFDQVLLIDNDGKIAVGAPVITDAAVTGQIIEHLRGDKVIIFKKNRRKGYQKRNGHRQDLTKIQIDQIFEKGAPKTAPKAEKKVTPKAEKAEKVEATSKIKAEVNTPTKKAPAKPKAEVKKAAPKASAAKPKAATKKAAPKKKTDKK